MLLTYFSEEIKSDDFTILTASWRLSTGVDKHIFIWFVNNRKLNNHKGNPCTYDTYNIGTKDDGSQGRHLSSGQLDVVSSIYYSTEVLKPNDEINWV